MGIFCLQRLSNVHLQTPLTKDDQCKEAPRLKECGYPLRPLLVTVGPLLGTERFEEHAAPTCESSLQKATDLPSLNTNSNMALRLLP